MKNPYLDKILKPTSQLDKTSHQNPTFFPARTLTSRLRRKPVKDYKTNILLLKFLMIPSEEITIKKAKNKFQRHKRNQISISCQEVPKN